jgi:uncharacterized protein YcbK (DUF882 family)
MSVFQDGIWRNFEMPFCHLKADGVGYYPGQFVHVDVGRIHTW